ncbi:MAG: GNAT family protein [Patescibacteria group bacterium]
MSIKLQKIKKSDLKYFLKWWKDKEIIKLTSGFYEKSDKVLAGYFQEILKNTKDHHYSIQTGVKVIGHTAIIRKNKNTFETQVVIGEKKYWGKGFGSQAIKMIIKTAFKKFGYKKAYLEVRPDNIRAISAYESCGFVRNGFKRYPKNKYQPIVLKMVLSKNNSER